MRLLKTNYIHVKYFKKVYRFSGILLPCVLFLFKTTTAQVTVNTWLTTGDKTKLLQKQANVSFSVDSGTNPTTIVVDENTTYQTMDGFGFTFSEGSAEVINSLNPTQENALLNELFNPSTGSGFSVVRISIGASDLSSSVYTYDQTSGDLTLNNFSLAGPDLNQLIPLLKKILIINPTIKFLATPWTAPTWMKTNQGWVGGSLDPTYYATYAAYFLKYLDAMKAQCISIWAITPQNEPENANNTPSMLMT
ncbi:MAG: beta-glucosidase, partial [Bacteroidetes bacterium]|nr:beta-glucosidase [Bacteroidota bacterium]